jgi:hypothetical protein
LAGELVHVSAAVRLRPARVALLVPKLDRWGFVTGLAIAEASKYWGGAHFILVPHDQGNVADAHLRVVAAYDPDHVVWAEANMADLMTVAPECHAMTVNDEPWTAIQVAEHGPHMRAALSPWDPTAAQVVGEACTPFAYPHRDHDGSSRVAEAWCLQAGHAGLVEVEQDPRNAWQDCWSHDTWRDAALIDAERHGLAAPPTTRCESEVDEEAVKARLAQIAGQGWDPRPAVMCQWADGYAWKATMKGLTPLINFRSRKAAWIVVGDTADDYCLAYNLSRAHGHGLWIRRSCRNG